MTKIVVYENTTPTMVDIIVDDMSIAQIDCKLIEATIGSDRATLYNDSDEEFASIQYDVLEVIP